MKQDSKKWATVKQLEVCFPGKSKEIGMLFEISHQVACQDNKQKSLSKIKRDQTYWNVRLITSLFPNWQRTLTHQPLVLECCHDLYCRYEDLFYPGLTESKSGFEGTFQKLKGNLETEEDENRVREAMEYINQMGFGDKELAFFNDLAQWDVLEKNELHRQTNRVTQRRSMQRL